MKLNGMRGQPPHTISATAVVIIVATNIIYALSVKNTSCTLKSNIHQVSV